jgi:hypothetical protein
MTIREYGWLEGDLFSALRKRRALQGAKERTLRASRDAPALPTYRNKHFRHITISTCPAYLHSDALNFRAAFAEQLEEG